MNVLLIYPEYPETFWNFRHALQFMGKKAVYPPLGLLTIAAMFPDDWDAQLVDLNVTQLREAQLRQADLVCISAMSIQEASARAVIARCRALGVPVLAGGPLFTSDPEAFAEVDYLVLNEAEVTFPHFLRDYQRGEAHHCYQSDDFADLRVTPVPRWELINMAPYAAMNIQVSRGCPYDCEFCNITALFGRAPRLKDATKVIAELDALYHAGWRGGVFFVDDNLISHKRKMKEEILPAVTAWMEARRYPFIFNAQVPINIADDTVLLAGMARAGFTTVFVGIESPNEASLQECQKTPNANRDMLASVRTVQQHGIQVQGGFIVGFDNDPLNIFERVTDFIQRSGIVTAMVGLLNAPYGTRLYQRLQQEGRLLSGMTGDNTDGTLNFIPAMPRETLMQGYQQIIRSIYTPRPYYQRVRHFLQDYRPAVRFSWPFRFAYLAGGAKLLVKLGLLEQERAHFWRLIFWALFTRPRVLPLAVVYSAYGFHFRKCMELHQSPTPVRESAGR